MKAIPTYLCNNILVRGMEENVPITPMKLQKLMYYTCREYVHRTGESPISERFEVWRYGPVLPSVYGEFRSFGKMPITEYAKDADGKSRKISESRNPVLARVLDDVWRRFRHYSGPQLSAMTHLEGSGWRRARMDNREFITVEDMANDNT